jgi:NADH-quinone oxidoreductase subunit M
MLHLFGRIFLGSIVNHHIKELVDVKDMEKWALISLVILMIAMGIYPKGFIRVFDTSIKDVTSILEGGSHG